MPVRVVDASAIGALIFGEPRARAVAEALRDSELVAPLLLWFELASVCLKKIQAHPREQRSIRTAHRLVTEMRIRGVGVDHAAVVELALEAELTTYDASYLWLARRLRGRLVTLDQVLARAAGSRAIG